MLLFSSEIFVTAILRFQKVNNFIYYLLYCSYFLIKNFYFIILFLFDILTLFETFEESDFSMYDNGMDDVEKILIRKDGEYITFLLHHYHFSTKIKKYIYINYFPYFTFLFCFKILLFIRGNLILLNI